MKNLSYRIYIVPTLLFFIGFLSSCCKTVDCTRGFTTVTFVKLTNPDIDTFYLRRYKSNTNFSIKIDTAIYKHNENFDIVGYMGDSTVVRPIANVVPKVFCIEAGYDYELVLPATGKVSRITDVTEENLEEKFCGMARQLCYTSIRTAKVNGVTYNGSAVIKN